MSASYQVLIKMVIKGNVKFLHWLKRSLIKMKKIANVTAADPALIVSGDRIRNTFHDDCCCQPSVGFLSRPATCVTILTKQCFLSESVLTTSLPEKRHSGHNPKNIVHFCQ